MEQEEQESREEEVRLDRGTGTPAEEREEEREERRQYSKPKASDTKGLVNKTDLQ